MNNLLNIDEASTDSPQYRSKLRQFEAYSHHLTQSTQALTKAHQALSQVSKDFSQKHLGITKRVLDISRQSPVADTTLDKLMGGFTEILAEIERNRQMQTEQLDQILIKPLQAVNSGILSETRQDKKRMDQLQGEYDMQLSKLMAKKPTEPFIEQHEQAVEMAKQQYLGQMQALSADLNQVATINRAEVLESYLSLMYAHYAHYHQAFSMFRDFEPTMRQIGEHIGKLRAEAQTSIDEARQKLDQHAEQYEEDSGYVQVGQEEEEMEDGRTFSSTVSTVDSKGRGRRKSLASICLSPQGQFQISGYLFLRSQYSIMASWQRRWFEIQNGRLVHSSRDSANGGDKEEEEPIPLHLCMVKRSSIQDRRNVFELVAPSRTYVLQAENAKDMDAWKACLRQTIEASLYAHNPQVSRASTQPAMRHSEVDLAGLTISSRNSNEDGGFSNAGTRALQMRYPQGNDRCADCGAQTPEWAAINLGILVCIECSGIHRSLGVHVSKVRSVKLDKWEPELIQIMQRLGNHRVSQIYGSSQAGREDIGAYIRRKYEDREFVAKESDQDRLMEAARLADMPMALRALAEGAQANQLDPATGATPLMEAVSMGDFGMQELLSLWGADANLQAQVTATNQNKGGSALHLATRLGNVRGVWYLIRKGAQWDTPDSLGLLPLDIALEDSNVQCVMALRYAAFQKEAGLPPGGMGNVEMVGLDESFIRDWAIPPYEPQMQEEEFTEFVNQTGSTADFE